MCVNRGDTAEEDCQPHLNPVTNRGMDPRRPREREAQNGSGYSGNIQAARKSSVMSVLRLSSRSLADITTLWELVCFP